MKLYHIHPETREYIGSSDAVEDPMNVGEWLIPAFTTIMVPPAPQEGKAIVANDNATAWEYVDDHRDESYWLPDGLEVKVRSLTEAIPDDALWEKPDIRTLENARSDALQAVRYLHARALDQLSGVVSPEERSTWTTQKAWADAYLSSGDPVAKDYLSKLLTQAESLADDPESLLAEKIQAKSKGLTSSIAILGGIKRQAEHSIESLDNNEDVDTAVESFTKTLQSKLSELLVSVPDLTGV